MYSSLVRVAALIAFAALCPSAAEAQAAEVSTAEFIAACSDDPFVADDPAFEESDVTPQAYCQCAAGKLVENKLSQADIDMLTKMHNEELTEADAESHPALDDLLAANEEFEDDCQQSLGLVRADDFDMEEAPMDEEMMLEEDMTTPEDEMPEMEIDGSPPE